MVIIESEVTLGMGPNRVDQDFCRQNEEIGGDLQGKVEKMGRLYLGGNAVWWFLGGCASAVFAVVFGIWAIVEWANLGKQPNWALLVLVFGVLPVGSAVGSAGVWLYWVSIINIRTGRVNKIFNTTCPESNAQNLEGKVQ